MTGSQRERSLSPFIPPKSSASLKPYESVHHPHNHSVSVSTYPSSSNGRSEQSEQSQRDNNIRDWKPHNHNHHHHNQSVDPYLQEHYPSAAAATSKPNFNISENEFEQNPLVQSLLKDLIQQKYQTINDKQDTSANMQLSDTSTYSQSQYQSAMYPIKSIPISQQQSQQLQGHQQHMQIAQRQASPDQQQRMMLMMMQKQQDRDFQSTRQDHPTQHKILMKNTQNTSQQSTGSGQIPSRNGLLKTSSQQVQQVNTSSHSPFDRQSQFVLSRGVEVLQKQFQVNSDVLDEGMGSTHELRTSYIPEEKHGIDLPRVNGYRTKVQLQPQPPSGDMNQARIYRYPSPMDQPRIPQTFSITQKPAETFNKFGATSPKRIQISSEVSPKIIQQKASPKQANQHEKFPSSSSAHLKGMLYDTATKNCSQVFNEESIHIPKVGSHWSTSNQVSANQQNNQADDQQQQQSKKQSEIGSYNSSVGSGENVSNSSKRQGTQNRKTIEEESVADESNNGEHSDDSDGNDAENEEEDYHHLPQSTINVNLKQEKKNSHQSKKKLSKNKEQLKLNRILEPQKTDIIPYSIEISQKSSRDNNNNNTQWSTTFLGSQPNEKTDQNSPIFKVYNQQLQQISMQQKFEFPSVQEKPLQKNNENIIIINPNYETNEQPEKIKRSFLPSSSFESEKENTFTNYFPSPLTLTSSLPETQSQPLQSQHQIQQSQQIMLLQQLQQQQLQQLQQQQKLQLQQLQEQLQLQQQLQQQQQIPSGSQLRQSKDISPMNSTAMRFLFQGPVGKQQQQLNQLDNSTEIQAQENQQKFNHQRPLFTSNPIQEYGLISSEIPSTTTTTTITTATASITTPNIKTQSIKQNPSDVENQQSAQIIPTLSPKNPQTTITTGTPPLEAEPTTLKCEGETHNNILSRDSPASNSSCMIRVNTNESMSKQDPEYHQINFQSMRSELPNNDEYLSYETHFENPFEPRPTDDQSSDIHKYPTQQIRDNLDDPVSEEAEIDVSPISTYKFKHVNPFEVKPTWISDISIKTLNNPIPATTTPGNSTPNYSTTPTSSSTSQPKIATTTTANSKTESNTQLGQQHFIRYKIDIDGISSRTNSLSGIQAFEAQREKHASYQNHQFKIAPVIYSNRSQQKNSFTSALNQQTKEQIAGAETRSNNIINRIDPSPIRNVQQQELGYADMYNSRNPQQYGQKKNAKLFERQNSVQINSTMKQSYSKTAFENPAVKQITNESIGSNSNNTNQKIESHRSTQSISKPATTAKDKSPFQRQQEIPEKRIKDSDRIIPAKTTSQIRNTTCENFEKDSDKSPNYFTRNYQQEKTWNAAIDQESLKNSNEQNIQNTNYNSTGFGMGTTAAFFSTSIEEQERLKKKQDLVNYMSRNRQENSKSERKQSQSSLNYGSFLRTESLEKPAANSFISVSTLQQQANTSSSFISTSIGRKIERPNTESNISNNDQNDYSKRSLKTQQDKEKLMIKKQMNSTARVVQIQLAGSNNNNNNSNTSSKHLQTEQSRSYSNIASARTNHLNR